MIDLHGTLAKVARAVLFQLELLAMLETLSHPAWFLWSNNADSMAHISHI